MTFWILLVGILVVGGAACAYWLREAAREWGLFEELLINDRKGK